MNYNSPNRLSLYQCMITDTILLLVHTR